MNILVTGARAPIAADLAKAFALSGHRVWMADSLGWPVGAASPFALGRLRLPPPRHDFSGFCAALAAACARLDIDAIVPTSEDVFWLAGAADRLRPRVDVRTSPLSTLSLLHHKGRFAQWAASLGYGAKENHAIAHPSDLTALGDLKRFVLKPVYSRFATQTLVAPTPRQIARLRPRPGQPWLAQSRVFGRELCAYNVAEGGRLLLHVGYEPIVRLGPGAGVYFAPIADGRLRSMCARMIDATGFTGQISFDVIDTPEGLVALECNPRGTSGVHLAAQQPAALAAALLGQSRPDGPDFVPAPRMLLLPLLLHNPAFAFRARGRRLLRQARDALGESGISVWGQASALLEIAWRGARSGTGLRRAATADLEWNGEAIGE